MVSTYKTWNGLFSPPKIYLGLLINSLWRIIKYISNPGEGERFKVYVVSLFFYLFLFT